MRQACRQGVEQDIDLAADQIGHGQRGSFIGNVHNKQARLCLEQLGRELNDGAVATGGIVQTTWIFLCKINPLLNGFGRRTVGHQHDAGRIANLGDRREIAHRVVRHFGV